ncbi:MAG: putative porin [Bacteroidales bacterium]
MNFRFASLFFATFFLFILNVSAQETDAAEDNNEQHSPDTASVLYFNPLNDFTGFHNFTHFRADLTNFQDYDPARKNGMNYATLGNLGLACNPIIYAGVPLSTYNYGYNAFGLYILSPENTRFFFTDKPFTNLYYVMGKGKQQYFDITHSQQLKRQVTIGARLNWFKAPGTYLRQTSKNASVAVYALYNTINNRYSLLASYYHNNLIDYENGGILYDSVFQQNTETDRNRIPVNLSNAQNHIKNSEVYFAQTFFLRKPRPSPVKKNDTTQSSLPKRTLLFYLNQPGCFTHTMRWSSQGEAYSDTKPNASFYPATIYHDSLKTFDSVYNTYFENHLLWSNARADSSSRHDPFIIQGGIWHRTMRIWQDSVSKSLYQWGPEAQAILNIFQQLELKGWMRYVSSGYHLFDFTSGAEGKLLFSKGENPGLLYFSYQFAQLEPAYFYEHYSGNYFHWDKSYTKQSFNTVSVKALYRGFDAGFSLNTGSNLAYLDKDAIPQQTAGNYTITQIWFRKLIHIGHWEIDNKLCYQNVAGADVVRLPAFTGNMAFLFNFVLFNHALISQAGVSCFYHSRWKGDAYMPNTRSFYLQDNNYTGGYLYTDLFLNFKVKRARIFIKYQHLNSGWTDYSYYMVPHYPQPDRGLRFGVSWLFYD